MKIYKLVGVGDCGIIDSHKVTVNDDWKKIFGALINIIYYNNIVVDYNNIFSRICHRGQLDVAKYVKELLNDKIDIHYSKDYCFRYTCASGSIEMILWLISFGGIDYNAFNNFSFEMCCCRGLVEVLKAMFLDGYVNNSLLKYLKIACENGYTNTYLGCSYNRGTHEDYYNLFLYLYGKLDTCLKNSEVILLFRKSMGNHLIARWLKDTFGDVLRKHDCLVNTKLFRSMCNWGCIDMALFLVNNNNKYNIVVRDNKIKGFSFIRRKKLIVYYVNGNFGNYRKII
jgi:hypothetical protein